MELAIHTNGSFGYDRLMEMTLLEKQILVTILEKKFKIESKNPLLRLLK